MKPVRRILLVDDETQLLTLLQRFLSRLGFEVDAHASAASALDRFRVAPEDYELIIADLNMPEMSGQALLQELLVINPAARVLICSGYPFTTDTLPAKVPRQFGFLQKPFLPNMLAETIQSLIPE